MFHTTRRPARSLRSLGLLTLILGLLIPLGAAVEAAPPTLTTLQPGARRTISQNLDLNIVLVGYEAGVGNQQLDEARFLDGLPQSYRTVNRFPKFYGLPAELGVNFTYSYDLTYAGASFEDSFFAYLADIGSPGAPTEAQAAYNDDPAASQTIAQTLRIEAPLVEQWLAANGGSLGVDTSKYTIFLINWYGRADFQHHVYVKTDEPDPDTGVNFGELDSRAMLAWGGTTPDDEESGLGALHRIWFYDLSAGPDLNTGGFDLSSADLDGDGAPDYRMPPVWEYGNTNGYRPFDDLSGDLAKIVRYVGINLLFTASPLYKPAISPPALPEEIQLDINVYQIDPAADGKDFFDLDLLTSEIAELQPLNSFSAELNDVEFDARFARVYECFYSGDSCFGNRLFGIAFGDMYLYHQDRLNQFLEGDGDYEIPIFAFNATDELFTCCLGYADDNWADGTQSFVFGFDAPFIRDIGYGFTTTFIHEVGHHLGMSHPHDGYDYETDVDYGPSGDYYYAWAGDQSNSMMSYIDVNWDFSQFDRDNMNRYLTSTYINQANKVLAKIYASPRAGRVSAQLSAADAAAASALSSYAAMDYAGAAASAKQAYDSVLAAAAAINVPVEPQNYTADYKAKGKSDKFIDTLPPNRLK